MSSVKVVPGKSRPVPVLPRAHFYVALEGMIEGKDGAMTPHLAMAEFPVVSDDAHYQLEVPHTGYMMYGIRVQRRLIEREAGDPEVQLALTVINSIPTDVWDACVAALQADTEGSTSTVLDILHGWGERIFEMVPKPLEPDGLAGLESEEEKGPGKPEDGNP